VQDSDLTQVAFTRAKEGLGLKFDAAPAIDGMTFKRAQMLAIDGAPLVQIAYLDDAGQPWALCITKAVEANAPVSASSFHDLATASWVKDGLGYVLVGGSDTTRVTALAESLTDRL
jgi:anti-sigma factor RsiW